MLKRALFASAVLVIPAMFMQGEVTPAFAAQIQVKPPKASVKPPKVSVKPPKVSVKPPKVSVKPNPRIRVIRPKVRIRIDTERLARDRQEKTKKDTMPGLNQPSANPAGYDNASMPGGDIPPPNNPTLDAPDGLKDLFELTGGNLNDLRDLADLDALRGPRAMQDLFFGNGITDPTLDGSGMGGQRANAGFDGPLMMGGQYSDGRASSGEGWVNNGSWDTGTTTGSGWTRRTNSGTDTYTVERSYSPETGFTVTTTITTAGPNGTSSTEETTTQPAGSDDGLRRYTRKTTTSDGIVSQEEGLTGTASAPNQEDGDGNGQPDNRSGGGGTAGGGTAGTTAPKPVADKKVGNKKIDVGDTKAGGGDQGGNYIDSRYSDRGGSIWTPLGGTVLRSVSPLDKTSQPPPTDVQGTVMVSGGKSGPTPGPEAVTNTGDGGFIAGEGRGGSGGSGGVDGGGIPCVAVSEGCGSPGGGGTVPGPAGSEGPPDRH